MSDPAAVARDVREAVGSVLVGNESIVEGLVIAALTGGHVLLEGVPGVAKTTTAEAFARATDLSYSRVQLTPDLLPADITGTTVYREDEGTFEVQRGPVFANVVVADEINRATPKTQSALLEAMQERRVTIEGERLALPEPFLVVATQNPIEVEGTFALPEAQRDRFQQKLVVELPDRETEATVLDRFDAAPDLGPAAVDPVVDAETLLDARTAVAETHVADAVRDYVLDLAAASRDHERIEHGVSPRASLSLLRAATARAAIDERRYVRPDDVKDTLAQVFAHRLVLDTDAQLADVSARDLVAEIRDAVEPPAAAAARPDAAPVGDGGAVDGEE